MRGHYFGEEVGGLTISEDSANWGERRPKASESLRQQPQVMLLRLSHSVLGESAQCFK